MPFTFLRKSCCVTSKQDFVNKSYKAYERITLAVWHKEGEQRSANLVLGDHDDLVIIICLIEVY